MPKKPKVILFAGMAGVSKTPVAVYLSYRLGLPVFNNDAIRSEVVEDLGKFSQEEYLKRRDDRLLALVETKKDFILDASIDRSYSRLIGLLDEAGYQKFLISYNLNKEFVKKLWQNKKYHNFFPKLDEWFDDHEKFLQNCGDEVGLVIDEDNYKNRLELACKKAKEFMDSWN